MSVSLWKFPKSLLPELKKAYLEEDWLWLINQYNEYMIGEKLCPVCPDSVSKIKDILKPLFLADIEILYKEKKKACNIDLVQLWQRYVSSTTDPVTVKAIPEKFLNPVICRFVNEDLKARGYNERQRKIRLKVVFNVHYRTFNSQYCNECQ